MLDKRYICPKQAAINTGMSAETIRRWLRNGKIPGKKVAGTWLVPEDFVELGNRK